MLKIWGRKTSLNVQKVMWAVGELALPHERIDAGGPFGGLDTADYGALNPNRLVPTIEDNGFVLWESTAIVRYLAAKHGASTLQPTSIEQRGISDQWIDWSTTAVAPDLLGVCFLGLIRTPAAERNVAAIAAAAKRVGERLTFINASLENSPFLVGETLTCADIVVGSFMYRFFNLEIQRPPLPHVERWYQALTARPAYQAHVMVDFLAMKVPGA